MYKNTDVCPRVAADTLREDLEQLCKIAIGYDEDCMEIAIKDSNIQKKINEIVAKYEKLLEAGVEH